MNPHFAQLNLCGTEEELRDDQSIVLIIRPVKDHGIMFDFSISP